ncbi:uncharacterized protein LOC128867103 [Anastrepha ludens]|uniref:uncharacterized protein LOC128867103 n=1 Tax=Anastrepha ludens TaxID=28586 RepID=UPI0023B0C847|nr:uncharacterized protein LOC128867103 [Anastrepha ludens]
MESVGDLKATFTAAHTSLEEMDFESIASDLPCKFDATLVKLKANLQREIGRRSTGQHCSTFRANTGDSQSIIVNANRSRLPLLMLPKFSGAYTEWSNFFSMFTSVIDNDGDLTQSDKLQYLRSCLSGAALDTIQSLEINETNYKNALDLLKKRFDNKRIIFQAHIRQIFGLDRADASASKLRELTDKVTSHIRALQSLGSQEQIADCIIVELLIQKLDKATQSKWEENSSSNELPSWDQLAAFLEKRCRTLENVEHAIQTQTDQVDRNGKTVSTNKRKSFVVSNASVGGCAFCRCPDHRIYHCQQFSTLSPNLRQKEAKKLSLCLNCLKGGHQMRDCKSGSCRACQLKHHTLLHFDRTSSASTSISGPVTQPPTLKSNTIAAISSVPGHALTSRSPSDAVLLATAVIFVKNRAGTFVQCRALLDSGSQLHFITNRFTNQLQLRRTKYSSAVSGIGDANLSTEGYSVNVVLKSRTSDFSTHITSVVVQTITDNQPGFSVSIADWNIPSNIQLADPNFNIPQPIDLLIGAGLFFELLCVGQIQLAPGFPVLQKTLLGWVISGGGQQTSKLSSFVANQRSSRDIDSDTRLDDLVRRFWEVDHVFEPITKITREELDCEAHFQQNVSRLPSGEYSVRLPLKLGTESLGESYTQAKRRFQSLERKLTNNIDLKLKYSAFIKEYLELNHMSLVTSAEAHECKYFLPHHCVVKEDSSTTKLRVVFDGSAVTTSGLSLNEILMAGPTIQPKLFDILIRFRTFPVALTGDICKMYRCVRVSAPDNMLQCILWRDSPESDIKVYKLDTVTYGTKPAAFLAIRAMHQLASDESSSYPLGLQIVKRDFYVDDLISGGNSVEEVREMMHQTTSLLARGKFHLRKWCSNNPDVLHHISDAERETFLKFDDGSNITKTLGLTWDPFKDNLLFSLARHLGGTRNSKRSALSTIARCYDPLGLIGPTLTRAKILLQRMWRDKLEWDESLPLSLDTDWSAFCKEFTDVQYLSFPRYILQPGATHELHAFCDASLEAFGVCVYARSVRDDNAQVHLLCSKARVAPLKTLTVPKLELCAAALLAQLINEITKLKLFASRCYCWSDSSVVLSWLQEEPSKFNVFVANRVCAIQQLTEGMQWRYVPTSLNPADILSRGAAPRELSQSNLWKHGPPFLQEEMCNWPKSIVPQTKLPEVRQKVLVSMNNRIDISLSFKYINSFTKMQRIFGYVHKFITTARSLKSSHLTSENIHLGTQLLIRIVQRAQLWPEYFALKQNQCVHSSSSISSLSPFLDDFGVVRVGGRLRNSTLSFEARHPIILPKDHPLTSAIIMHFHRKNCHAGPQSSLAAIRMQFWPIGGRKTTARTLQKCVICCRSKPKLFEHIMADLPKERIQASRAFIVTGVDYCGPFYFKPETRNKSPQKCYISVFICFATKAVWMELVRDFSTGAFLEALKRFTATRGMPSCIWSDNATNFVGAKNELRDLKRLLLSEEHRSKVHVHCLNNGFDWRFIPPRSPHFGGLWEAAVKMAKQHLYRTLGSAILSFDELRTLVCQISAIINSRPLVPLSENPEDLDVLTPGHFLIGGPLTAAPEPNITHLNYNRLGHWQRVTYFQQLFWKRWSEEYLTLLQQRAKWRTPHPNVQINDIVCIKDENSAPLKWPLARVIEVITGEDGVARVAVLRTSTGLTRRAVTKLCLLPTKESVESPELSTEGRMLEAAPNLHDLI